MTDNRPGRPSARLTHQRLAALAGLEGRRVSLSLSDGSRIDDCLLAGVPRRPTATSLWIIVNGEDTFLAPAEVVEVWEAGAG